MMHVLLPPTIMQFAISIEYMPFVYKSQQNTMQLSALLVHCYERSDGVITTYKTAILNSCSISQDFNKHSSLKK